LVRKSIGQSVSVSADYNVDSISCASVDVVSFASPYTDEREETTFSMDYLNNKTLMSLSYTKSDESDYLAETSSFSISHDMFGDLTTVSLSYAIGNDDISKNTDLTFNESAKRQNYKVGLSQILTKSSLLGVDFETITDEGFLNSPYRSYRYYDGITQGTQAEKYPRTRTSNALTFQFKYFLPYRAVISSELGFFNDTWGIDARHFQIGYTHPLKSDWIFDVHYRYYTQGAADFYSDLFRREDEKRFMARDKEMSTFQDHTIGVGVSYEFKPEKWRFIEHGSVNLQLDYIRFNYDDFRDMEEGDKNNIPWGEEPLYSFDANVIKVFLSIWY
jgi:hypothetical protein